MTAEFKKNTLKLEIARRLSEAKEIRKIVVFGSFLHGESPEDIDVAIFQDSNESYLPLALRYRRLVKPVSDRIPLDIIPLRPGAAGPFLDEINKGEVIYER